MANSAMNEACLGGATRRKSQSLLQLVAEMRSELDVLLECLASSGLLKTESFLAQLHRTRFNAVLHEHPLEEELEVERSMTISPVVMARTRSFSSSSDLCDAMSVEGVAATLASFAGVAAVRFVGVSCRRASTGINSDLLRSLHINMADLYMCGGWDDNQNSLNLLHRYDRKTSNWEVMPSLLQTRAGPIAAATDDAIYVCGGWREQRAVNSVERFSLTDKVWQFCPPMSQRRHSACGGIVQGRLCICGGWDGENTLEDAEYLDTTTFETTSPPGSPGRPVLRSSAWRPMLPMAQRRAHAASGSGSGFVYLAGGWDGRSSLAHAERWSVVQGAWETLPDYPQRVSRPSGTVVDGCFIVCGGWVNQQAVDWTVRFDPRLNAWEYLRPMLSRRAGGTCASLAGKVFVLGGWDGEGCLDEVELMDPNTGVWERSSAPLMLRCRGAAALAAPN